MCEKNKLKMQIVTFAAIYTWSNNDKKRKKSVWVKEWREKRINSDLQLIKELRVNHPEDFKNYLRMDSAAFEELLKIISPIIQKKDTVMRESISPEERLVATLRFLATGRSYEDLKFSKRISAPALSILIPETCKAIYNTLRKDYLKFPTSKDEWLQIAQGFKQKWDVINCGGALDGKHIRITPPPNSGALYYNYKGFYSFVLMALVNSNYEFIFVDVGKNGRISDGGVIEHTEFHRKLQSESLCFHWR